MRRVLKMVGVELVDARAAAEHQQEADDYHCAGPRHGNEVGALEGRCDVVSTPSAVVSIFSVVDFM